MWTLPRGGADIKPNIEAATGAMGIYHQKSAF
jgi:hypothetical protein